MSGGFQPRRQKHPRRNQRLLTGTTGAASATCTASTTTGATSTSTCAGACTASTATVGTGTAWHRIGARPRAVARTGTCTRRGGSAIGAGRRCAGRHHAVIGRRSPRGGRLLRRGSARCRCAGIRNGRQNGAGQQAAEYEGRNLHLVHCRHLIQLVWKLSRFHRRKRTLPTPDWLQFNNVRQSGWTVAFPQHPDKFADPGLGILLGRNAFTGVDTQHRQHFVDT